MQPASVETLPTKARAASLMVFPAILSFQLSNDERFFSGTEKLSTIPTTTKKKQNTPMMNT